MFRLNAKKYFVNIAQVCVCVRLDYRYEDREKLLNWEGALVPLERSWVPHSSEHPNYYPKNNQKETKKHSIRRCIWGYHFQPRVCKRQILDQVVQSQLFTCLRDVYHEWLPNIEPIQMSTLCSFLFMDHAMFHCWKENLGLILSRNSRTENDHFHIFSPWLVQAYVIYVSPRIMFYKLKVLRGGTCKSVHHICHQKLSPNMSSKISRRVIVRDGSAFVDMAARLRRGLLLSARRGHATQSFTLAARPPALKPRLRARWPSSLRSLRDRCHPYRIANIWNHFQGVDHMHAKNVEPYSQWGQIWK